MKSKLLIICILLLSISVKAQYTVEDSNGDLIQEGDMVVYGATTYPEGSFDFYVNNTSSTEDIRMRIEFVSAVNADGSMMELCFGECYTSIVIGESYPVGLDVIVPPGGQTGEGNHFYNADPGNGTDMLDYVFRFFQVDATGNEIGTSLTMTYRYDPALSVSDFEKLDVSIESTIVRDLLAVNVAEEVEVAIFDLQGRIVVTAKLDIGEHNIDVSNLNEQMYIVKFVNTNGASQVDKIIVK